MLPSGGEEQFLIFVILLLIGFTVRDLYENRAEIFDANLTDYDASMLMRAAFFLVLPIVVFIHECGHAALIMWFGGRITEFHYSLLWGYVAPEGMFTESQKLLIYYAGSFAETVAGIIFLAAAVVAAAPPTVSLCVYSGLLSIGSAFILYPLLSLASLDGDWIVIYSSPERHLVNAIVANQIVVVGFTLWAMFSMKARLWFLRRTRLSWYSELTHLNGLRSQMSTNEYAQRSARLYLKAGLPKLAQESLKGADSADFETMILQASIFSQRGALEQAIRILMGLVKSETATNSQQARAWRLLGNAYVLDMAKRRARMDRKDKLWQNAFDAFVNASSADPTQADARFYQALLLVRAREYQQALPILHSLAQYSWRDEALCGEVPELVAEAEKGLNRRQ